MKKRSFCFFGGGWSLGTALNSPKCSRGVSMQELSVRPPSQPAPLFTTPGHLLDKFIKDFLQPDKQFLDQIAVAVDFICKFLQKNCFRHSATKVQKTVKVSTGLSPRFPELCSARRWTEGTGGGREAGERGTQDLAVSRVARALLPSLTTYLWLVQASGGCCGPLRPWPGTCTSPVSASVSPSPLLCGSPLLSLVS